MNKFRYLKEYDKVVRLYFEKGSMTLSKLKNGPLLNDIVKLCKRDNKKYRNSFKVIGDYVEVYCWVQKTKTIRTVLIDLDDWQKYNNCYFSAQYKEVLIVYNKQRWRLHRLVMGLPLNINRDDDEYLVDHINKNTFDNRKQNLRITDDRNNMRNIGFFNDKNKSSGVRGVTESIDKTMWRVRFGNHKLSEDFEEKLFYKLSDAVEYRYKKGKELGFLFHEGSTTIENYIKELKLCGK